jgi:hypothetical protein
MGATISVFDKGGFSIGVCGAADGKLGEQAKDPVLLPRVLLRVLFNMVRYKSLNDPSAAFSTEGYSVPLSELGGISIGDGPVFDRKTIFNALAYLAVQGEAPEEEIIHVAHFFPQFCTDPASVHVPRND